MTETPRTGDDPAALRDAIEALTARLDRIEAQAAQPSAFDTAQERLTGAWDALRNGNARRSDGTLSTERGSLLWTVLTVCAVLLALILAIELVDEIFDGLWHLGRWID
jgi:hypothetical protein